ncbi:MAG: GTP pyrophosphokinase [Planctomycetota bacterium]|jgi:(p)ppGpp synthase/HD superfamily hydrolase
MPTLEDAIILAVEAHRGQVDKNDEPYILHPLRVMLKMTNPEDRIVGVLHDVIEDTPLVPRDLAERGYPKETVETLEALSKRAGESYEDYIERAAADPVAARVKMADLEDNLALGRVVDLREKGLDKMKTKVRAYRRLKEACGAG